MWYQKFDTYVLSSRSLRSKFVHCIYYKFENGHILIIVLYVDNMLFIGNGKRMISALKSPLATQFVMKHLGAARYILGVEIIRDRATRNLWMS